MSSLLPCPFCGGKPTAIETHPGRGELYCGKCDLVMCGDNAKTPEELTQAWNTRHVETCKVVGSYYSELMDVYVFSFSCRDSIWWNDEEPPNYCPECGRKVER